MSKYRNKRVEVDGYCFMCGDKITDWHPPPGWQHTCKKCYEILEDIYKRYGTKNDKVQQ